MNFDLAYENASRIDGMLKRDLGYGCASCGSLALVRHGLLVREVGDIDLMITKAQVKDQELLEWVEQNGRWLDSNTPTPEATLAAKATLAAGHLQFFLKPRLSKNHKRAVDPKIKVELYLPTRYPFKTQQGRDVIDFTCREVGRDPRGGAMNVLSPEGAVLWKILMKRQADRPDLIEVRDRAFQSHLRLNLDGIEKQLINVEGPFVNELTRIFRDVFRPTDFLRNMSGDADGFGAALAASQAGAYR